MAQKNLDVYVSEERREKSKLDQFKNQLAATKQGLEDKSTELDTIDKSLKVKVKRKQECDAELQVRLSPDSKKIFNVRSLCFLSLVLWNT
jgi:hypothetical protein